MNRHIGFILVVVMLFSGCALKKSSPTPTTQTTLLQDSPTPVAQTQKTAPAHTQTSAVTNELSGTPTSTPGAQTPTDTKETPQSTPGSQSPVIPVTGIHIDLPITTKQLNMLKESGVYWTRTDVFHWDKIQPTNTTPAVYDWSSVDETALQTVSANGLHIIAAILFTPAWAQKNPGILCGAVAPQAVDQFADFIGALVSRYSQPPYNIKYWEIGNEPDIDPSQVPPNSGFGCWGDKTDAYYGGGYYAGVLKAIYPRLKAADPQSQLIVGGLLLDCDPVIPPENPPGSGNLKDCSPARFLEGILKNGGGAYFDGLSLHSYDYYGGKLGSFSNPNWHSSSDSNGPTLVAKARYVASLLAAYGVTDKYVLGTELALICGRDGTEAICRTPEFEATKAAFLVQAMAYAQVYHFRAMTWYGLYGWRGSGLVSNKTVLLPAYQALKFYTSLLGEATYKRPITDFSGVTGFEFQKGDQRIWVLWSGDGNSHSLTLASIPKQIYNLSGEPMTVQSNIDVGQAPIYLVW